MADDPRSPIVQALLEAFLDAFNRHDAKAIASTFSTDADFYNFRGRIFTGRETIEKFFTKAFGANLKESHLVGQAPRIRLVGDAAAAVDLLGTLSGMKDPTGAGKPDRRCLIDGTASTNPNGGWWLVVCHLRELPPEGEPSKSSGGATPSSTPAPD